MILQIGVKVIAKNSEGKVLLLRRTDEVHHGGKELWDIPGGRIEAEEKLFDALAREVSEETNLTLLGDPKLLAAQDIIVEKKDLHVVRLTYQGLVEGSVTLSHEHDRYQWVEENELAMIVGLDPYLKEII